MLVAKSCGPASVVAAPPWRQELRQHPEPGSGCRYRQHSHPLPPPARVNVCFGVRSLPQNHGLGTGRRCPLCNSGQSERQRTSAPFIGMLCRLWIYIKFARPTPPPPAYQRATKAVTTTGPVPARDLPVSTGGATSPGRGAVPPLRRITVMGRDTEAEKPGPHNEQGGHTCAEWPPPQRLPRPVEPLFPRHQHQHQHLP